MKKFNMFAAGWCAAALLMNLLEGNVLMSIAVGVLTLGNLLLGLGEE